MVGNDEKSSGLSMKSVIVNMSMASAKDVARPTSSTQAGIGRIIMTIIAMSAIASRIVGLKSSLTDRFGTVFLLCESDQKQAGSTGRDRARSVEPQVFQKTKRQKP
jgi:hypothetical protein